MYRELFMMTNVIPTASQYINSRSLHKTTVKFFSTYSRHGKNSFTRRNSLRQPEKQQKVKKEVLHIKLLLLNE